MNKVAKTESNNMTPEEKKDLPIKYDRESTKKMMKQVCHLEHDPDYILEDWGNNIFPDLASKDKDKFAIARKKFDEKGRELISIISIDKHYICIEAVGNEYRTMVLELARELEEEYKCSNPSEKALIDMIATSYGRYIQASRKFNGFYNVESVSEDSIKYYNSFAKEADRAQRQFTTAIFALNQLKNPGIELKVNAKTAMINQYQQIVAQQKNEYSSNEKQ